VRDAEWIRLVLRFEIDDLDRFREMAEAMAAMSAAEPGTTVYDWYLDEATNHAVLYEAYASQDALQEHVKGAVFTELVPKYAGAARVTSLEVFGGVGLPKNDLLGAPTTWWGAPIAAITPPS
jgi:quinol monooxygenase YgiN